MGMRMNSWCASLFPFIYSLLLFFRSHVCFFAVCVCSVETWICQHAHGTCFSIGHSTCNRFQSKMYTNLIFSVWLNSACKRFRFYYVKRSIERRTFWSHPIESDSSTLHFKLIFADIKCCCRAIHLIVKQMLMWEFIY